MNFKDLRNLPLFKADKQRIFDEALGLAKNKGSGKQYGKLVDPQVIEFRVHYVTSVRIRRNKTSPYHLLFNLTKSDFSLGKRCITSAQCQDWAAGKQTKRK